MDRRAWEAQVMRDMWEDGEAIGGSTLDVMAEQVRACMHARCMRAELVHGAYTTK